MLGIKLTHVSKRGPRTSLLFVTTGPDDGLAITSYQILVWISQKLFIIDIKEQILAESMLEFISFSFKKYVWEYPNNKVHGANMGPIWGRQDPGRPHVCPMNLAIWVSKQHEREWVKYHWRQHLKKCKEYSCNFSKLLYWIKYNADI